jgi:hypothetical protein
MSVLWLYNQAPEARASGEQPRDLSALPARAAGRLLGGNPATTLEDLARGATGRYQVPSASRRARASR